MDWEQTIKEMGDKGLIRLGIIKDGDRLIAELRQKVARRNELHYLWYLLAKCPIFELDWFGWMEYGIVNRN